jgi:hypothetical protein
MSVACQPDLSGGLTAMAECGNCGQPQMNCNPILDADYGRRQQPLGSPASTSKLGTCSDCGTSQAHLPGFGPS